jgi:sodium-dependent dicarboxylate transporter 2/3/5
MIRSLSVAMSGLFLIISFQLPVPEAMGDKGWVAFGLLLFSIVLWATQIIPAPITSLIVVVLTSLTGLLTFEEAAGQLGNDIIWLIIAMLIMGAAVKKTLLDKRLSYQLLILARGNTHLTLLGLIGIAFVLTFFIPNAVGRLTVLLPIGMGIITNLGNESGRNYSKAVMLAITYAPYISTIMVITAASGSIYAVGLFDSMLGYHWSYVHWMILMVPIATIVILILWLVLIRLFPSDVLVIQESNDYFNEERKKLGQISSGELKLIILYVLLIVLWVTNDIHHMPLTLSALMVVVILFLPGFRLIQWNEAAKDVDWGIPFIFTAGFILAKALETSGFVRWLSSSATAYLHELSALTLVIVIMLIFILIRMVFTSYMAMAASMMPVALTFAVSTPYNPVWLGMICLIASSTAYLLPTQSVGGLTTFTMGYYSSRDMLLTGAILTISIIIITLLAAFLYWPIVGLSYNT